MKLLGKIFVIMLIFSLLLSSVILMNIDHVSADSIGGDLPPDPDTVWTLPATDYDITSDIIVPAGKTLNLVKGTKFIFPNGLNYKITVKGTLNCDGDQFDKIWFISNRAGPRQAADWQGFIIDGGTANFNHCIIDSAGTAIKVKNADPILNFVQIRDANIGIDAESSSFPKLYNSSIENCIDRDIKLQSGSNLNLTKSHLKQTGIGTLNPSIEILSLSRLKATNSIIDDKYKYTAELNGMAYVNLLQCDANFTPSKIKLIDSSSRVIIKYYLSIYVGTKTKTGEDPIIDADVTILDDTNAVYNMKTDVNGSVKNLVVTHLELSQSHTNGINDNVTDVNINYANIFQPSRQDINMSRTHKEEFINNIPSFNFASKYEIAEDTKNNSFLDLWSVVDDDFDSDNKLNINLVGNTAANISGKEIAAVKITNNRWLEVDLFSGDDNNNWTGNFSIKINASDQLGLILGLSSESAWIPINVLPVNDPPMWIDVDNFHLNEDMDLINAMNVRDHIYDVDNNVDDIIFSITDYDKSNYVITINENDWLDIKIIHENHTAPTDLLLTAFDGKDYGNYSLQVVIEPQQDSPAINKSLVDFDMDEDTTSADVVDLNDVFIDTDGDSLNFSTTGNEYIAVDIDPVTGFVSFTPDADWFGIEEITIHATDNIHTINDTIEVTVKGINDAPHTPVIIHPMEFEDKFYKVGEPIIFSAYAFDIDIDNMDVDPSILEDKLSYTWTRNTSVDPINVLENFTYTSLPEGKHEVTVTVTDIDNQQASASINVEIFGEYSPPNVRHLTPLPDYWTNIPNVRLEWEVEAEPESLPFIRYDVYVEEFDFTDALNTVTPKAEQIKTQSYTIGGLRDRATYYWTVIPYISTESGVDLSGTWFFTYDKEIDQIYDLSLEVEPKYVELFPGENFTISISVSNKGNMPDRFEITLELEKLLEDSFVLSESLIVGTGDGIYGMTANEIATVTLTITIPDNFDFPDNYDITITAKSLSRAEEKSEDIELKVLEKEDDKGGIGSITEAFQEGSILMFVILFIIVIIVAVIILIFAYMHKHKKEEEEIEEEDEREEEPEPVPATMPPPTPVEVDMGAPGDPLAVPGMPQPVEVVAPLVTPSPDGVAPEVVPAPVPAPAVEGAEPQPALPEGETAPAEGEGEGEGDEGAEGGEGFGTVMCGPCGADIPLTSNERPLTVTCGECGNSFTVKS